MKRVECRALNGSLFIEVPLENLKFATEHHPELWDGESDFDTPDATITNMTAFAEAVADEINDEAEDGSTPLLRMLDRAIYRAIDNGCEGVE